MITDQVICAGSLKGGVGVRHGDNGGPMVMVEDGYYKLCGVTSFVASSGCANAGTLCPFRIFFK